MRVVSNTLPVLNPVIVGWLALLHEQFGEVRIPAAVLEELCLTEDLRGSEAVQEAVQAKAECVLFDER